MGFMTETHYLQRTAFIWDSKVDIASRLYDRGIAVDFRAEFKDFSPVQLSELCVGPTKPPFQWVTGILFTWGGG